MKILFVLPRMGVGGAERVVLTLCRGLKARQHTVAVASEGGAFADVLESQDAVQQFRIEGLATRRSIPMVQSALALRRALREFTPDIVNIHAYMPIYNVLVARALARSPVRCCFSLHAPEKFSYYKVMGPTLARMVDDVSAVCVRSRRDLYDHGYPESRGVVLYNGIEENWLRPLAEVESRPLPGTSRPIRLGVLARLGPDKGIQTLIEAMGSLAHDGKLRHHLSIAGDGPYRPDLEDLVQRTRLSDSVSFLGRRDDAQVFLDQIDVMVLPSYREAFPMSLLEAMARGTVVLSTGVGGIPELVTPGKTGFLFPEHNPAALARCLDTFADSPDQLQDIRRRARSLVEEKYLTHHMVTGYERWFKKILEGSGRGVSS